MTLAVFIRGLHQLSEQGAENKNNDQKQSDKAVDYISYGHLFIPGVPVARISPDVVPH